MPEQIWTDDAAINAWLEWLQGQGKSLRTIEAYGMALRRLHEFLKQDGQALLDADPVQLELFTGIHLHRLGVLARSMSGWKINPSSRHRMPALQRALPVAPRGDRGSGLFRIQGVSVTVANSCQRACRVGSPIPMKV